MSDGEIWPCATAREALAGAFGSDSTGLSTLMAYLMGMAAAELAVTNPTRLYQRFVGWTLDERAGCSACGRRGHRTTPDLPPRLCPCDKLHQTEPGTPESATSAAGDC